MGSRRPVKTDAGKPSTTGSEPRPRSGSWAARAGAQVRLRALTGTEEQKRILLVFTAMFMRFSNSYKVVRVSVLMKLFGLGLP